MELVRVTTCGSVDDGKSTLIGRLLQDTGQAYDDQLAEARRAGASRGDPSTGLACLIDGLRSEREQGITIDVAYRYLSAGARRLILADCPGHAQYTRNMITGLSTADAAVLLLDAARGVREQTRRHLLIAGLMGTPRVIIAVNKMDAIGWDQAAYDRLAADIGAAAHQVGVRSALVIPISALPGDNILTRAGAAAWYRGPCLAEALAGLERRERADGPVVLPVQGVLKVPGGRRYTARLANGTLKRGMRLAATGARAAAVVSEIYSGFEAIETAVADQALAFAVAGDLDLDRGETLLAPELACEPRKHLDATLFWLDQAAFDPSRSYLLRHLSAEVRVVVDRLTGGFDLATLAAAEAPAVVGANAIVTASLRLSRPLPLAAHAALPALGRFVLIDQVTRATVAAGLVG